jgi:uncharacterized protein (TIGR01777 family)
MKILVSGSHGLVGSALTKALRAQGDEVLSLVRNTPKSPSEIAWQPNGVLDPAALDGIDVVVHLAGESIAAGRWNDEKKRRIRESRINGTTSISEALANNANPPRTFVCASAIGYYGNRGDELLTEASARGEDFLSGVCVEWERATGPATEKGIRVVNARFGIILSTEGGALAKMLPPFRMGVGGRIGDGKQWMSWIALADVINGLMFVIRNQSVTGPVNFVAPNPVTNAEFTKTLGKVLSRPTIFPIPAFAVRLAFGEMADALLLSSARVEPVELEKAGFTFAHNDLESALRQAL